jgi:CubicO group peptidase (beta-lactamase class C family)
VAAPLVHLKYSNAAYSMLGLVIQTVSGLAYEDFVSERLLRPLGMDDTVFALRPEHRERFAHGHVMPPYERRFERAPHQELKAFSACGMLASTPADVLKIARLQWTANSLLPAATRDEMHRLHLMDPSLPGWRMGYGLGWRLSRYGDRVYAGHGGAYIGNRCQIEVSLADRVGVALFANRGGAAGIIPLAAHLLTETVEAVGPVAPSPLTDTAPPDQLKPLLGQFHLPFWYSVRIEYHPDGLHLVTEMDGGVNVPLVPVAEDKFVITGGRYVGEELTVLERGPEGTVRAIRLAGSPMMRI